MLKYILSALLFLIPVQSWAGVFVGFGQSEAPSVTYLINEDFEGTGTPSGWTMEGGTIVNYDYTSTVLAGSQSFFLDYATGGDLSAITPSFTGAGDIYIGFMLRASAMPSAADAEFIYIRNAADANQGFFKVGSDGHITVSLPGVGGESSGAGIVSTSGTTYIKIRYQKGTGSNGIITGYTSSNGTSWTQSAQLTGGTGTTNITYIRLIVPFGDPQAWIIDNFKVATSDFNF